MGLMTIFLLSQDTLVVGQVSAQLYDGRITLGEFLVITE
jgi:hypothetical protein